MNERSMPSFLFCRPRFQLALEQQAQWDVVVIGGGATGLGIAVDSAARGYSTLLLEQSDFAKGTSSRSTKLVHGGVRYLAQGNISLVYEALRERGLLRQNAPHLVRKLSFVIPCYSRFAKAKYLLGLKLYDLLSGRFSFGKAKGLTVAQVMAALPQVKPEGLIGGVEYLDGQFDDARLAINLAQTAAEKGAVLLNYCKVTGLQKEGGRVCGLRALDLESRREYGLKAKAVINATGVFVDDILQMDSPGLRPTVRPSQGVHLVFDKAFFQTAHALMIPKTADGRVLFALPWHGEMLVGTTDTPLSKQSLEPVALPTEIDFILATLQHYLSPAPRRSDVKSVFAGLRPLAAPRKESGATRELSRDHKLLVSASGLITLIGGKWTTYRKMAEEAVTKATEVGRLPTAKCTTKTLRLHGCTGTAKTNSVYGSDGIELEKLKAETPSLGEPLASGCSATGAEVVWAVRAEMARTVEDVLARRLRLLFLNANAAVAAAPKVAGLMAAELNYTAEWEREQVEAFTSLAQQYKVAGAQQGDYERKPEVSNLSS